MYQLEQHQYLNVTFILTVQKSIATHMYDACSLVFWKWFEILFVCSCRWNQELLRSTLEYTRFTMPSCIC